MVNRQTSTVLKIGSLIVLVAVIMFSLVYMASGQDPATRGMSDEKKADYFRLQTEEAIARTPKVKKEKVYAPPTDEPITPEPLVTGVIDERQPPFPSGDFLPVNSWMNVIDGNIVIVYAGAEGADFDQNQGLVIVASEAKNGKKLGSKRYKTPDKVGPVRITTATGNTLTLVANNGATFVFDVEEAKFK